MNDPQLMQSIFSAWQGTIAAAVEGTLVPAELLAALVANESGGNTHAQRFEPAVFTEIAEVLAGKRTVFKPAGISRPLMLADLVPFVVDAEHSGLSLVAAGVMFSLNKFYTDAMQRVAELATSYGLVQIMGWHWIEFNRPASLRPEDQLAFAVVLLVYFANKYTLDLAADAAKLFSCWNTGEPGGHTYNPLYVPNGLARMELYRSIAAAGVPSAT
jgi:hypothetical protein